MTGLSNCCRPDGQTFSAVIPVEDAPQVELPVEPPKKKQRFSFRNHFRKPSTASQHQPEAPPLLQQHSAVDLASPEDENGHIGGSNAGHGTPRPSHDGRPLHAGGESTSVMRRFSFHE